MILPGLPHEPDGEVDTVRFVFPVMAGTIRERLLLASTAIDSVDVFLAMRIRCKEYGG